MNKYFIFGCIPLRFLLAFLVYIISIDKLPYIGILLFAIGLSFVYLYLTDSRLDAPEAGGKTWWNAIRPIHGMLYITAAIYAFKQNRYAYVFLVFDVLFGLGAYLRHIS
jgi:hypothetical protein